MKVTKKDHTIELAKAVVTAFWEGEPGRDWDAFYDRMVYLNNELAEHHGYESPPERK